MIKKDGVWTPLGQTLKGERGEGISNSYYYVGDQFGTSLAISEKNSYNGTGPSNTIKVVVGAPKNDPDGTSGPDYYNGHVEVWEINPDETNAQFSQVAYDIDGGSSGEKSGTSVAIDSEGKSILVGSPGYEASSISGYFEGVAKMYEQTEYSAVPSVEPSSVPSLSMVPSLVPYVSMVPSVAPSVSIMPSSVPSDIPSDIPSDVPSDQPSLLPSSMPSNLPSDIPSRSPSSLPSLLPSVSMSPSSLPSAFLDKEFQILSTFEKFDSTKDWCLTASEKIGESKLHVRPCRPYDSRSENLQLWKFTESGALKLAGMENGGNFCAQSIFRQVQLKTGGCDSGDVAMSNFSFENGSIIQRKNSKDWKLGFDPESRFERVRLYRDGTLNEVLNKWDLRYSYEFPSKAPSPPPTMPLNLSNQVVNTDDSLVGNLANHRLGALDAKISSDGMTAYVTSGWMNYYDEYVNFYRRTDSGWEPFHQISGFPDSPYGALSGNGKVYTVYDRNKPLDNGMVMTYDVDRESGTVSKRNFVLTGGLGSKNYFGNEMRLSYDGSILAVVANKYVETYKWNSASDQWELRGTRFPNIGNVSNSDSHRVGTLHLNEAGTIIGFNHKGYKSPLGEDIGYPHYREGAFQMYTWNESDEKWEEKGQFVSSDLQQSAFGHLQDTGGIFNEAGDIMVVAAYAYRNREWKGWPDENPGQPYWREMGYNNIRGRVWIYKFNNDSNQWDLSQILDGEGTGSYFGSETSMNSDGSILVIANNQKGETRVYNMGADGQYHYTPGTALFSQGGFRSTFGYKSQIAATAKVLMVTDPDYDSINGQQNVGKVWFYEW